jgi:hypothetical protein
MNRNPLPYPPQMRNGGSLPAHLYQDPLPYPPQMRNGGSPPAHLLPYPPQMRNGGSPPTHFSPPLTAAEVAELDATNLNWRRRHETTAREQALMDEANKQRRAATQDKALADEANEQRRHESAKRTTTSATKTLAKDEYDEDEDYVAQRIEAYAAPFSACVDAVMAEIQAMDDGLKTGRPRGRKRWPTRSTSNNRPRRGRKHWLTSYVRRPCGRKRWGMRPTSYVRRPRGRKRWRTRPKNTMRRPRTLRRWLRRCWPTSEVARNRLCAAVRSKWYADTPDLVFVLVAAMAPEPPIHMSTFFVVGDIGPALPTNLI